MPGPFEQSDIILWQALRYGRPDGSHNIQTLTDMIKKLLPRDCGVHSDKAGNLWIEVGYYPSTLFQAHLDDVSQDTSERDIFWTDSAHTTIETNGKSILGADDGAGIAILVAMILSGVPGIYLFSQGEESGSRGGHYAVDEFPYDLSDIQRCIAFDRRGSTEICGMQHGSNLASHKFVDALADMLGLSHVWGEGTYTDNSLWADIIPEIVNISVGYDNEHTFSETLNYEYFRTLRERACSIDWDALPVGVRDLKDTIQRNILPQYTPGDACYNALAEIEETLGYDLTYTQSEKILDIISQLAQRSEYATF